MAQPKLSQQIKKEICIVCAGVMSTSVSVTPWKREDRIGAFRSKRIKWSKVPCGNCLEMKSKGFILIGAVESKTTDKNMPYRSGNIWCVKREVANQMFNGNPPHSGVAFVDVIIANQMGLPDVNLDA